ncbi:MAG TPA: 4-(cytidine 5'-diphospho)-2-C-methyl-D-erythritol kinase [Sedimentisphaerales bacterium]|nr:4-(cytidine 5'-diphospho)-2-C-methyl-D-erythritol kinase [Sedimentisphaerales bacterium]
METTDKQEQFQVVGQGLLVRAPAKINLSLLVAGKRDDGFHEIETVMAKIDLFDEILIEQGGKEGIELVCGGPHWAPPAEENLVHQACKLLLESCGVQADIKVTLTKNIPAGSGLGSASSDAAAALMGVNRFLKLDLDVDSLSKLAATLGSDVAFFLNGPLAFCTGRGEKIRELSQFFKFAALLVLPDVSVSTKKVYGNYRHDQAVFEKLSAEIAGLIGKNRIDLVWKMCANMLEESCFALYKELAELRRTIESLGIGPVCLSGSGSAMFTIIENGDKSRTSREKHKLEGIIGCKSVIVSSNRW